MSASGVKRVLAFTPIPKHLRPADPPPVKCSECGQTRHDADTPDYACCMTQEIADVLASYGVDPYGPY